MRTKTLLLTASIMAAGLGASMAQVYSVNAVGYVNYAISRSGFACIANPLNGTNNLANTVLKAPADALLYRFVNGHYTEPDSYDGSSWLDPFGNPSTTVLNPGEGFFLYVPAAATITFVGEVPQGANLTNPIPAGFSIRASVVPQSAPLNGANSLNFPAAPDDTLYFWQIPSQNFAEPLTYDGTSWLDGFGNPVSPTPAVAQAFFINKLAPATWTRSFSVN